MLLSYKTVYILSHIQVVCVHSVAIVFFFFFLAYHHGEEDSNTSFPYWENQTIAIELQGSWQKVGTFIKVLNYINPKLKK